MTCNTHRVYKMVSQYNDKNNRGEDIVVTFHPPKKKLLGAGSEAHCQAIAAKTEGSKVEAITGGMSASEWV